jgi:hypothetical protein
MYRDQVVNIGKSLENRVMVKLFNQDKENINNDASLTQEGKNFKIERYIINSKKHQKTVSACAEGS